MLFFKRFPFLPVPESLLKDNRLKNAEGEPLKTIDNLGKINIFVGENNSGKSFLMREIIKENTPKFYASRDDIAKFKINLKNRLSFHKELSKSVNNNIYNNSNCPLDKISEFLPGKGFDEFLDHNLLERFINDIRDDEMSFPNLCLSYLSAIENTHEKLKQHRSGVSSIMKEKATVKNYSQYNSWITPEINNIERAWADTFSIFNFNDCAITNSTKELSKIYIHNLRTLDQKILNYHAACKRIYNNLFNVSPQAFEENVVDGKSGFISNVSFETGSDLYEAMQTMILRDRESRDNFNNFEAFLSKELFTGKSVSISPSKTEEVIKIKIDNEEKEFYKLGTGIQMLIIMIFPLFFYDDGMIFIEEPELFLHPRMQHKLMSVLSNTKKSKDDRSKNFQFFIATHSNHIIDTTLKHDDISLFTIQKKPDKEKANFIFEHIPWGNKVPYELLGCNASSIALSNCVIWVEGISDKIYIEKYIREVLGQDTKSYQEGIHYSYMFSAGSNIAWLDYNEEIDYKTDKNDPTTAIKFLARSSYVVIDKDNDSKGERKANLKEVLKENLCVLDVTEIENMLPLEAVIETVENYLPLKKHSVNKTVDKNDPDLQKKLESVHIGTFIDSYLKPKDEDKKIRKFATKHSNKPEEKSYTLKDKKRDFALKAVKHIKFENMTDYSKEVARNIIDFIKFHNPTNS